MAELQITYEELRRQISRFFIGSRSESEVSGNSAWLADANDIMLGGLRSFYWPAIPHRWSFLDLDRTLDLEAGVHTYRLPVNFSRLTEAFTFPVGSNKRPVALVPMKHLRALRSRDNATGDPVYYSIQSADNFDGGRTVYEVSFYPTPSEATTLSYSMEVEPLVADTAYDTSSPLGGAMHAETIIEACLAVAENRMNPEAGPGFHSELFQQLLAKSIETDKAIIAAELEQEMWPLDSLDVGVASLHVTKSKLERLIGRALGYQPNPKTWNHNEASAVAEVLRNGLRKFYQPMVLPGERESHQWSFLSPVCRMNIIADQSVYDLPEDFAMVTGQITYSPSSSIMYPNIILTSEEKLRYRLQSTNSSARPYMAAVRVKHSDENTGTRYEMLFAPIPSEDRQISFPYSINPEQLGSDQALPMGGQPHAQTIIEACLAAAEIFSNTGNTHQNEFLNCLRTSVSHDRISNSPQTLGYNGDRSDGYGRDAYFIDPHDGDQLTTYNGAVYWD